MIRRVLVVAAVVLGAVFAAPAAYAQYQPGEPGIVVIPSTVTPGETVTVQGFGCPRASAVTIQVEGQTVAATTAADDSEGSFLATFPAPSTVGVFEVTALCAGTVLSTTLTVIPVAVSPSNASQSELPVTGSNLTLVLVRSALALVAVGGLVLIAVRQRRTRV